MELSVPTPALPPFVRRLLWADSAVEATIAAALTGLVGAPHAWLDVSRSSSLAGAAVFALAAVAIAVAALLPRTTGSFVQQLAFANIVGGVAVWAVAVLSWDRFDAEGRWLIGAGADSFIALGALELLALRRTRTSA